MQLAQKVITLSKNTIIFTILVQDKILILFTIVPLKWTNRYLKLLK